MVSVGSTPSLTFRCRDGQEKITLVRVRINWWLLGTFTVQLMGRPGQIPGRRNVVMSLVR